MRYLVFALLTVALQFHCTQSTYSTKKTSGSNEKPATLVNFVSSPSLSFVLEKAVSQEKLVFIDMYTDWCAPCKLMDKEVFTNRETADYLNRNFVNYKVDAERNNGPDLAFIFGVKSYPTLLFLDSEGKILVRKTGAAFHSELKSLGQQAIEMANRWSYAE